MRASNTVGRAATGASGKARGWTRPLGMRSPELEVRAAPAGASRRRRGRRGRSRAGSEGDRGYAIALAAALVLSLTGIFISHIARAHGLPPLELALWRAVFVVAAVAPWLALRRRAQVRVSRQALPAVLGLGLSLAAMNILWTIAVARVGAALGTVLIYSAGAFTAVLGAAFFRERLGPAKVVAVVACAAGCTLVSGVFDDGAQASAELRTDVLGVVLGGLSGLAYAAYGLAGRAAARRGVDAWAGVAYAFAISGGVTAVVLGAQAAFAHDADVRLFRLGADVGGWLDLALLAAGPTLLGFGLYAESLRHLPASVASLVVTLESPLAALIAWAALGERLTLGGWVGSAVVLAGVVVLRLGEREAAPRARRRRS